MADIIKMRDEAGRFVPGVSGNPQGRPGLPPEVREVLAAAAPDAARRLVQLIHSEDPRVAGAAAGAVLDRLYGKPGTSTDLKVTAASSAELHHAVLLELSAQAVPVEHVDATE